MPEAAIRDEAFIIDGRFYGYFGPTPALLRVPAILCGVSPGHLTKLCMLGYFVAALLAAYLLLLDAVQWLRSGDAKPSAWAVIVLLTNAGVGSTLFFLAARPMMYHEAIACGATFALWSAWCALRFLHAPATRWWIGALVCALLSLHARPTTGFFALSTVGLVAAYLLIKAREQRRKAFAVGVLCVATGLTLNGLAYLKFGTFDSAPYEFSRPYLTNADRYGHVGHQKFHLENIPWGFSAYLVIPNFHLQPRVPYFVMAGMNSAAEFPRAKIDLPDFTIPAPYSMPALFVLSTAGALAAFALHRRSRPSLGILWLSGLATIGLLFAFIAAAQRYMADACPFLVGSAAFAVASLDLGSGWLNRVGRLVLVPLSIASVLVSAAIVFDYQARWGPSMPDRIHQRYERAAEQIDRRIGLTAR